MGSGDGKKIILVFFWFPLCLEAIEYAGGDSDQNEDLHKVNGMDCAGSVCLPDGFNRLSRPVQNRPVSTFHARRLLATSWRGHFPRGFC